MFEAIEQARKDGYEAGRVGANVATKSIMLEILGVDEGPMMDADPEVVEDVFDAKIRSLPLKSRKALLREFRRRIDKRRRDIDQGAAPLQQRIARLDQLIACYDEIDKWLPQTLVLERPGGSVMHHLRQQLREGRALLYRKSDDIVTPAKEYEELFAVAQPFMICHDWAGAFKNATEYDGEDFRLPADVCFFEFKVSGRSVAILTGVADEVIYYEMMVRSQDTWFIIDQAFKFNDTYDEKHDGKKAPLAILSNFLRPQIKAVCVALEAEIAETEVVRAPHKLNRARVKAGKVPLEDYHIVSLSRRERVRPREDRPEGLQGIRRLHFRRGHWRHYETFKTWVRWTLVGNPDLGFVDKEYRL